MVRKILVVTALLLLVGCASREDVQIYQAHYDSRTNFDKQQTLDVDNKADGIRSTMNFDCGDATGTEACGALKAVGKMWAAEKIASIERQEYGERKPKTSLDVQESIGIKALNGIPVITMGVVAYKNAAEQKGTTTITADNQSSVTTNYEEQHATALAEGATANNQPNQDNSTTVHEVAESEEE